MHVVVIGHPDFLRAAKGCVVAETPPNYQASHIY
jgi:hypothetical protein